ncbi:MAG: glycohydrolase toxin TNT-related protein [Actinomycetota bacterium]
MGRLSDALGTALAGGISSGMDPAGMNFGLKYGHQAGEFTSAVADAANAFKSVGMLLQATGYNYRNADAAATIGGPGPSGGVGAEPDKTLPAHVPAGPNGVTVPPPDKWYLIQPFLQMLPGIGFLAGGAMTWPSGNAPIMGVTATQWRNFATGFALIKPQLSGIESVVAAQQVPEGAAMKTALKDLGTAISSLTDACTSVAQLITDFANGVQETQDAIRRILDRLSLDGLWDTVKGIFTGEADDILREVAHDVSTVLHNFQNQVKGVVGLLEELTGVIGDAATAFQKWIRPILVQTFGDGAGNVLADYLKLVNDVQVGALTGLIGTVSGVVAMADPDTWKGMAEMALSVAKDPFSAPGVLANMAKEFVAWDKWSGDHPGRAAGEAIFNIGSLFVPGGALSKTGNVAKGLNLSRRVLEEGRLPKIGELGSWTRATPSRVDTPHIPEFNPSGTGGVPPLRPEAIPGGAGPGTPGAGLAPSGGGPSGGSPSSASPSGGGPRTGEPSAPSGRPSGAGAEGGSGPRAPVDAGRGGGGETSLAAPSASPGGGAGSGGGSAPPSHGSSSGAPEAPTEAPAHSAPTYTPEPATSSEGSPSQGGPSEAPTDAAPQRDPSAKSGQPNGADMHVNPQADTPPSADAPPHGSPAPEHATDASPQSKESPGHTTQTDGGRLGEHAGGGTASDAPPSTADGHNGSNTDHHTDAGRHDHNAPGSDPHAHSPVHSHEPSGDGWHRIDDKPDDPNYGQPLEHHWESGDYPTPNDVNQRTFDLVEHPEEPYGHDEHGNALTKEQYDERYNEITDEGKHELNYPPNDGAVPGTRVMYESGEAFMRDYGPHLDRIGGPRGAYLGVMPEGIAPSFESRALPVASLNLPYNSYSISALPSGWSIEVSQIAPAFGRDGGALQVLIYDSAGEKVSVERLVDSDILERK